MGNMLLKITSSQVMPGQTEEEISQFMTMGKVYEKGNEIYIIYEETELSGLEGNITTLKISENTLKLLRFGQDKKIQTKLEYISGKRKESSYMTPAGPMEIAITANNFDGKIDAKAGGKLSIDYDLEFMGMARAKAKIDIEVIGGKNE